MKELNLVNKWLYASKLKSWPKILVPFVLGNVLGIHHATTASYYLLFLGGFATVLGVLFIVLLNDWGDQKVDKIKREMFPDRCSPKTIPDNILSANHLLVGGLLAGILSFCIISYLGFILLDRKLTIYFALASCLSFMIYTLPPIKLNYRGGGELLEMFGVGFVLPLFMFYLQTGIFIDVEVIIILIIYSLLSLSSAIASGFSDEQSDRIGGKHTFVTSLGNRVAHRIIFIIVVSSGVLSVLSLFFIGDTALQLGIILAQLPYWIYFFKAQKWKEKATTNAFIEQGIFKSCLHTSIWGYGICISLPLFISDLLKLI